MSDLDISRRKSGKRRMGLWLFILIPARIAGAVWLALSASKEWPIDEIDQGVVETYCRLVAEERYDEAYEQCLSAAYRREVSREDFAGAHAQTREERGALQSRELLRIKAGTNLFTRERSFQLLYLLTYPNGDWRD